MLLAATSCLQQSDTNNLTSQPCQAQKNPTLQTCLPSRHFTNFPSAPILYSTSASPRGPPRPSRIMSSSALWSAALSSGPEALDGRVLRHLWHCTQAWHRRVTDVTDAHRCAPGLPRNDATHVSRHTRSGPPAPQHINEAWALCTCSTAHAHTPQNHGHVSVSSPLSLEAERPSPPGPYTVSTPSIPRHRFRTPQFSMQKHLRRTLRTSNRRREAGGRRRRHRRRLRILLLQSPGRGERRPSKVSAETQSYS